jgi:murein DD-endopeptidase MepM/ murein hydrolase activator NlpD
MKKRFLSYITGFILLFTLINPIAAEAEFTYAFPVPDCKVTYSRYHHDYPATDIQSKLGCPFVAPIGGVIQDVSKKDRWSYRTNRGQDRGGLSISFIGDDGVRYYGSHLLSIESGIESGVRVEVGQKLGAIGTSGSARGTKPHLHFGISYQTSAGDWQIRRGVIAPWKFLDAWRLGKNLSPVRAVEKARIKAGK